MSEELVTPKQIKKLIGMVEEKSREQMQVLFSSGLLFDLLRVNPLRVDRNSLRQVLGLSPVLPVITIYQDTPRFPPEFNLSGQEVVGWKLHEKEYPFSILAVGLTVACPDVHRQRASHLDSINNHDASVLGQRHAEKLLDQQKNIPEAWRDRCIFFPKTCWEDPGDGEIYWPYICFDSSSGMWKRRFASKKQHLFKNSYCFAVGFDHEAEFRKNI